jgi:hypothetical protein
LAKNDILGLNSEFDQWKKERVTRLPPKVTPFDIFCAEQFLKPHILLTDKDILRGVVGNSDDGGVDSFYFLLNGMTVDENTVILPARDQPVHLVFIQTKESKGFAPTAIDKFDTFTDDLLDLTKTEDKYGRVYHEKLLDLMRILRNSTPNFRCQERR